MTTESRARTWIRVVALMAGCALGVAYLLTGRVPHRRHDPPARVSLSWTRTGDLVATPARQRIASGTLKPGKRALGGAFELSNPTRVPLSVRPRDIGRRSRLDSLLTVEVLVGNRPVFEGSRTLLRGLRAEPAIVAPGAAKRVRVKVSMPGPAAARLWSDRAAQVELEWRTAPVRR